MTLFGVTITLGDIVDLIILFGAFCAAVYKIWDFFAKPTNALKQKRENREKQRIKEVLDAELPPILKKHDLETRDKYKADRQQYLKEIKEEVLKELLSHYEGVVAEFLERNKILASSQSQKGGI